MPGESTSYPRAWTSFPRWTSGATGPPTLLTVARLEDEYKGHDVVLRALTAIRERVPDVTWVVVGEGSLRPRLEGLAAKYGVEEQVRFLGDLSDEERDRWYRSAHVFVMPSRLPPDGGGEGFGIVYLEAAAHGLPGRGGRRGGRPGRRCGRRDGSAGRPDGPPRGGRRRDEPAARWRAADAVGAKRCGARRRVRLAGDRAPGGGAGARAEHSARHEVRAVRVLYLNHTGETSGAERSLLTLLEGLPDGVWPLVACPDGPLVAAASSLGVPVELVAGTNASLRLHPLRTPRAIGEILASAWRVRGVAGSLGRGPGARQLGAGGADRGARQATRRAAGRRGGSRLPAADPDIEG